MHMHMHMHMYMHMRTHSIIREHTELSAVHAESGAENGGDDAAR